MNRMNTTIDEIAVGQHTEPVDEQQERARGVRRINLDANGDMLRPYSPWEYMRSSIRMIEESMRAIRETVDSHDCKADASGEGHCSHSSHQLV